MRTSHGPATDNLVPSGGNPDRAENRHVLRSEVCTLLESVAGSGRAVNESQQVMFLFPCLCLLRLHRLLRV